jgi:hypothetical protein
VEGIRFEDCQCQWRTALHQDLRLERDDEWDESEGGYEYVKRISVVVTCAILAGSGLCCSLKPTGIRGLRLVFRSSRIRTVPDTSHHEHLWDTSPPFSSPNVKSRLAS